MLYRITLGGQKKPARLSLLAGTIVGIVGAVGRAMDEAVGKGAGMPKFVLVDNSLALALAGGHHFEFAESILSTAERAGYSPFIGANQELPESAELAKRWPTFRVFPSGIYHDFNLFYFYLTHWGEREAEKRSLRWPGPLRYVTDFYNRICEGFRRKPWEVKRSIRCDSFLNQCIELFEQVPLAEGDIVMLPTVSDVELEGLGAFLSEHPETAVAEWHLYFHNNFLLGLPHEYNGQGFRLGQMAKSLKACLDGGKKHNLHFYTTTEQLANQFDQLKLPVAFRQLTFPVRAELRRIAPQVSKLPKRVVCAGGFRDERGQITLPQIVAAIWSDLLRPGYAQVHVQRSDPQWQVPLPAGTSADQCPTAPIVYHAHPLSTEAYNQLIQEADLGLLLHDPHTYYSRLSAVYQEYVCAGIPVIVPGGCWLGDQIAEENSRYIEHIVVERQSQVIPHEAAWRSGSGKRLANQAGGRISFRGSQWPLVAETSPPNRATEVIVQFRWPEPLANGQYVRATLELQAANGEWKRNAQVLLGPSKTSANLATMFHLRLGVPGVRVVLANAFDNKPITIAKPQLTFIATPEAGASGLPIGLCGVSFSERCEIPRLIREVLGHYDHYRRRAQEKSPQWCRRLEPIVTLTELTSAGREKSTPPKFKHAA